MPAKTREGVPVFPVLAMISLSIFLAAAFAVVSGHAHPFDFKILDSLRETGRSPGNLVGPDWLYSAAVAVTAIGSTKVLCIGALVISIALATARRYRDALLVLFGIVGASYLNKGLKLLFQRERPDEIYRAVEAHNASFPSGHAMASAAAFLILAVLIVKWTTSLLIQRCVIGFAVLMAVTVGLTRIYLGVHWTTDVVAGWSAGVAWAMLCLIAVDARRSRLSRLL